MIKAAIFDMDGTLLDSMPIWEHASERYLADKGIKAQENLAETLFSMSMSQGAAYVKRNYKLPEDIDTIVAGVNTIVFDFYQKEAAPKVGVRQFLDRLKGEGIPMAVATSTDRPMVEAALKRNGLLPYFEHIFTCTEVGAGKVKPDIYLKAQELLGMSREETWVFEDALYAIDTAKKAGFPAVGIYDHASRKQQEQIRALADIYITEFTDEESLGRLWQ
jgi:HAD superfamily hydrolase (TIGR01509 family)